MGEKAPRGGELTIEGIAERERNLPKPQKRLGWGKKKKKAVAQLHFQWEDPERTHFWVLPAQSR